MSDRCRNPLCNLPLPTYDKRPRAHCNPGCRLTHWILRKAAQLLAPLSQAQAWAILYALSQEDAINGKEPG